MEAYNFILALFVTVVGLQSQSVAGAKERNSSFVPVNIPMSERTQNELLGETLRRIEGLEKKIDSLKSR